jgi:hypothetical protein
MNRNRLLEIGVLAIVIAVGTWFGGWWAAPAAAALWQLIRPAQPSWFAGVAAVLAWCGLLARLPWLPLGRLVSRLSGVFHLPPGGALLFALAFTGLLAWSAARLLQPLRTIQWRRKPSSQK